MSFAEIENALELAAANYDTWLERSWAIGAINHTIQYLGIDPIEKFGEHRYEIGRDPGPSLHWAAKIRPNQTADHRALVWFNCRAFMLDGQPSAELLLSVVFHEYIGHGDQLDAGGTTWTLENRDEREVEAYLREIAFGLEEDFPMEVIERAETLLEDEYGPVPDAMMERIRERYPEL